MNMSFKNILFSAIIGITALQSIATPRTTSSRVSASQSHPKPIPTKYRILLKYILEQIAAIEQTSLELNAQADDLENSIEQLKHTSSWIRSNNRKKRIKNTTSLE